MAWVTAPGLTYTVSVKLCRHGVGFQSGMEVGFGFGWRDFPDRLEQAVVVDPVIPFKGRVLDGLDVAPGGQRR